MSEQSGPKDPAERHGADGQGAQRPSAERPESDRLRTERPGVERSGASRPRSGRPGSGRPRQPAPDVFGDLQRWFIRQSAKNMRNQIGGQMRRTLGGGRETTDVWDTATTEIPPEVGESPECQWCPICRAARRMRDSGPGIGGQLSGAGDVVATAVQDAISALDSLLSKASGASPRGEGAARDSATRDSATRDSAARDSAARDGGAGGGAAREGGSRQGSAGDDAPAGPASAPGSVSWLGGASARGDAGPGHQHGGTSQPERDGASQDSGRGRPGLVGLPGGGADSARAQSAPGRQQDPWAVVSDAAEAGPDTDGDAQTDEPGHEPDDRG